MVEAHARAVAASVVPRATKGIPGRTMDMITQELMFVLEGSDGAAERCAAMESLFWLQVCENCIHRLFFWYPIIPTFSSLFTCFVFHVGFVESRGKLSICLRAWACARKLILLLFWRSN